MRYYVGSIVCDSDYLEHHGIKGQKWGVRRYQNPDGTLTEAGRARYGNGDQLSKSDEKRFAVNKRGSARSYARSMNRMDEAYAESYGNREMYKKMADRQLNKAAKIAQKKYGGDTEAAKSDKRYNKHVDKAADRVLLANKEDVRMKKLESETWKRAAEAVMKGYDVSTKKIARGTIARGQLDAQIALGVIGQISYSAAMRALGNPLYYADANKFKVKKRKDNSSTGTISLG